MSKRVSAVLMVALALAVAAACAGCGSAAAPQASPSTTPSRQASPAKTPSSHPSVSQASAMRKAVHADIAQIMADIDAAEKRGDVVDGMAVGMSSNPYDYVGISPVFVQLVALGEPALPAIAAEIEASSDNGVREYLLAAAGAQIAGEVPGSGAQTWQSGKEWARQYRAGQ
jgi:ABC-type transport system substrate-binding protein